MVEFVKLYVKSNWFVLFQLFTILLIAQVFKQKNLYQNAIYFLLNKVKNKKVLVYILTNLLGFLPIPGRITVASGVLDTLQEPGKNNEDLGILAYLATHHYYLWSPLEKAIIITIGVAGISYFQFIKIISPFIILYFTLSFIYTKFFVDENKIHLKQINEFGNITLDDILFGLALLVGIGIGVFFGIKYLFIVLFIHTVIYYFKDLKELVLKLDWTLLLIIALLLIITTFIKHNYTDTAKSMVKSHTSLMLYLVVSFILSIFLGSSSRYAALAVIGISIFGVKYLPLIYMTEYAGYFISPFHKCTIIAAKYFKTPLVRFFTILISFISIMYAVALIYQVIIL